MAAPCEHPRRTAPRPLAAGALRSCRRRRAKGRPTGRSPTSAGTRRAGRRWSTSWSPADNPSTTGGSRRVKEATRLSGCGVRWTTPGRDDDRDVEPSASELGKSPHEERVEKASERLGLTTRHPGSPDQTRAPRERSARGADPSRVRRRDRRCTPTSRSGRVPNRSGTTTSSTRARSAKRWCPEPGRPPWRDRTERVRESRVPERTSPTPGYPDAACGAVGRGPAGTALAAR